MTYRFKRPAEPFQFSNRAGTITCLEMYGIEPYPKLLKEIEEGEALIALEYVIGFSGMRIVRYIRPLSVRITHDTLGQKGLKVRQLLREYKLRNGVSIRRKSSLSGKMRFYPEEENVEEAFLREREQELGIPRTGLAPGEFIESLHSYIDINKKESNIPIDMDVHESEKFPGIITHSTLVRRHWFMPDEHYNPEGYVDPETGNIFRWANEGDND